MKKRFYHYNRIYRKSPQSQDLCCISSAQPTGIYTIQQEVKRLEDFKKRKIVRHNSAYSLESWLFLYSAYDEMAKDTDIG